MPPKNPGPGPVGWFQAWYSLESEGQTRFIRSNAGAVREAWKLFEGIVIFNQEKPKVFEILQRFWIGTSLGQFFEKKKHWNLRFCKKKTLVLNEFLISKTEDVAFVGMIVEGRKEDDHPPRVNSPSWPMQKLMIANPHDHQEFEKKTTPKYPFKWLCDCICVKSIICIYIYIQVIIKLIFGVPQLQKNHISHFLRDAGGCYCRPAMNPGMIGQDCWWQQAGWLFFLRVGEKGGDGQKLAKLLWSWTGLPVLCKKRHWVSANVLQETATEEESGKCVWNRCEYVFHALGRKLQ